MHNFKELNIWKDGISIATDVSEICMSFPDYEKFGLASQLRRCSVSVPSNIAEGCG